MKNVFSFTQKFAGCLILTLAIGVTGCQSGKNASSASSQSLPSATVAPATATPTAAPAAVSAKAIRIKAGVTDPFTDAAGNVWMADQGAPDGDVYEATDVDVTNTKDPALYRTEHYSMSAYNFDVPNGKYTVKLYFAEVYSGITGPGERIFSFNVQGHEFKDFDIWAKAGGFAKAYVESVDVEVTNGKLNITFTPNVENPKINAIEILPRS